MPAVTPAEVRSALAEFGSATDYPDSRINAAVTNARLIHDIRKQAVLYLAAHFLAIEAENTAAPDGGAGVVSSEKIGPRSVTYVTQAKGKASRSFFATTSYGRIFLALADTSPRAAVGARVA